MVSTKWFQSNDLADVLKIRTEVFINELNFDNSSISDNYDSFGKSVLVYENGKAVGTGRLIFKDGKYIIDKLCVLKEYRNNSYGELIVRMLVRKAVDMGAQKTYSFINKYDKAYKSQLQEIYDKVGFVVDGEENENLIVVKHGDVGGHCGK
jgi:predicted GNAT family N-acyltransferase